MTNYSVHVSLFDWERSRERALDGDPRYTNTPAAVLHAWLDELYLDPVGGPFDVSAETAEAAAELVYEITNSYPARDGLPEELHCPPEYCGRVSAWRRSGNRSVSVGDLLHIRQGGELVGAFLVARVGFELVA